MFTSWRVTNLGFFTHIQHLGKRPSNYLNATNPVAPGTRVEKEDNDDDDDDDDGGGGISRARAGCNPF